MLKRIFISLAMLACIQVNAQVQLLLMEPLMPELRLSNVFSFQVISVSPVTVKWKGELYNGNVRIASGESDLLSIEAGSTLFDNRSGSFSYNYTSNNNTAVSANGDLPFGNYRICVNIFVYNNGVVEQADAACINKLFTPLSPPYLISPLHNENITIPNPLLTWSMPMPLIASFSPVYKIKVAEVLEGQSCFEALQSNLAVYEADNLTQNSITYPVNAVPLKKQSRYAWGINTRVGNHSLGNTEVWCFNYPEEPLPVQDSIPEPYIVVGQGLNTGNYITIDGKLYLQYFENYNGAVPNFRLFDKMNHEVGSSCNFRSGYKQGDNRMVLDFGRCPAIQKGSYRIDIIDANAVVSTVMFTYK